MKVLIISAHFKKKFFEQMAKFMNKSQVKIIESEWWEGKTSISKIKNEIKSFNPDIIYTDDTFSATIISKLTNKKIPVVLRFRGNWWIEFKNKLRWSWKHWIFSPANYTMNSLSFNLVDGFIPICNWLRKELEIRYPKKISDVVYQGINPKIFYPEKGMIFKHPSVGIIQDHNILPKVEGLLKFRDVTRKLPEVNFKIAGGGRHINRVRKHFLKENNVEIIGRVPYPHGLRQFLTEIDVYVIASGLDCCPTTVLEASLMKKPVIGSKVGGIPEIIDQGKSGWSIPNEKPQEWIEKIELLINNTKKARKIGAYGKKWVSKNFHWKILGKKVEKILKKYCL